VGPRLVFLLFLLMSGSVSEWAVEVTSFNFSYGSFGGGTSNVSDASVILRDVTLRLPWGSRALVVGLNGSGKSTLLKNIAGKHFHDHEKIKVAGQPAFFSPDTQSVVSLIGSEWRQDFSKSDIGAFRLIEGAIGYRADKAKELIDMFQVNFQRTKNITFYKIFSSLSSL
jgi:ATPase subunit of ABC transporter with duplicated ATPase domains